MTTETLIHPDTIVNPGTIVGSTYKKSTTLQLIEYLSAATSVGGLIATAITQQAIFSAAPLTVSVLLNLVNRQKLDQMTRQHAYADTTEIHRRASAEIQGLRSELKQVSAFEGVSGLNAVKESINTLADQILALQSQAENGQLSSAELPLVPSQGEFVEFQNKQLDLQQALSEVQRQLELIPSTDRLNSLQTDITALQIAIAHGNRQEPDSEAAAGFDFTAIRTELEGLVAPIQHQLFELAARVDRQPSLTMDEVNHQLEDLRPLQGQVEHLRTGLDELKNSFSEQVTGILGHLENAQDQVQAVQEQLTEVQMPATTGEDEANLNNLDQQMQSAIMSLQEQLRALEDRLTQIPVAHAETPQASGEQVQALSGQFEYLGDRIETLSIDLGSVHRTIEETRGQIQAVQEQLTTLQQQAAHAPAPMGSEELNHQLRATVTPLQEQLSGLEGQFNDLRIPEPEVIQTQIEHVQHLQGQFEHLKEQFDKLSVRVAEDLETMPKLVEESTERHVAKLQSVSAVVAKGDENLADELDFIVAGL
jgi:predicted  nucleic acid-binding Zn-ribbon protein